MKKQLFLLAFAAIVMTSLTACGKTNGDDEPPTPPTGPKALEVFNDRAKYVSEEMPDIDGSLYDSEIVFYDKAGGYLDIYELSEEGSETIEYNGGTTGKVYVPDDLDTSATYFRVSFKLIPPTSEYYGYESNERIYTDDSFGLKAGDTTEVYIDEDTLVTRVFSDTRSSSVITLGEFTRSLKLEK